MAEETKVYTTSDNGFSDGAMMGALLGGKQHSDNSGMWAALAANCNNNRNNMWDNPFAYLIFLMFAQNYNGFGGANGNGMAAANNQQLQTIQNQLQDNHNSDLIMSAMKGNETAISQLAQTLGVSVTQLSAAINGVQNTITAANGDIKLAAERMIANQNQQTGIIGSQMQQGFCGVKQEILNQGYQNQLGNERQTNQIQMGFNQLQNSFTNGFTSIGYQLQQGFNTIKQNECDQTQKIVDILNNHWAQEQAVEISTLKAKVATMEQTQALTGQNTAILQAIQALANSQTAARTSTQAAG